MACGELHGRARRVNGVEAYRNLRMERWLLGEFIFEANSLKSRLVLKTVGGCLPKDPAGATRVLWL